MASGEDKSTNDDFYAVLGLKKECSPMELRRAYKKLALRWHPDRCSASGSSEFVEEAKKKFQSIQQAYAVLSDANKRFLYDVGAYDSDDDENGMGDFLNEMASMMSQSTPHDNGEQSFQELKELFDEMFPGDIGMFGSSCDPTAGCSSYVNFGDFDGTRSMPKLWSVGSSGKTKMEESSGFDARSHSFFLGVEHQQDFKKGKGARGAAMSGGRRHARKQKVESNNCGISTS